MPSWRQAQEACVPDFSGMSMQLSQYYKQPLTSSFCLCIQLSEYDLRDKAEKQEEIARFTKAGPLELDNPLLKSIWLPYVTHFAERTIKGTTTLGDNESTYSRVLRNFTTQEYAWAIPSNEALSTILSYGRNIVEIGSGRGYWASLLAAAGGNVTAVDDRKYDYNTVYFPETVHQDGAAYLKENGGAQQATLFVCWGGWSYKDFDDALVAFKGKYLAVVGEDAGGCTWWPEKHPYLKDGNHRASSCINMLTGLGHQDENEVLAAAQLYEQWERVQTIPIPQWQSSWDHLAIFQRK